MKKLEEQGTILFNRNLHIYTYALHLKDNGHDYETALEKIQQTFDNDYVFSRECLRTIKSAVNGSKHFACQEVKSLLQEDLFDCDNCDYNAEKSTFLIPRSFITLLQKNKSHYMCYKLLLNICHSQQIKKEIYQTSIKSLKHKKNFLMYFEKLKELGLINYTHDKNFVYARSIWKNKKEYKSHIVIPAHFVQSNEFVTMKHEIKLFMELWRSSIQVGKNERILFFNVKIENLASKIHLTKKTILNSLKILKKNKLVLNRFLFVFNPKREFKSRLKKILSRFTKKKKNIKSIINRRPNIQLLKFNDLIKENKKNTFEFESVSTIERLN